MANDLSAFLAKEDIILGLNARCKRGALKALADHAARRLDLDADKVFEALMSREQLGSTGIGRGIAIPHAKIALDRLHMTFARVAKPIDFDAVDDEPVDLLFLLLAPEEATTDHLKALARVARLVRPVEAQKSLRGAGSEEGVYGLLTGFLNVRAA
ncbi:PtsN, PTS system, nitrogen regulatory IIA component [Parvularcula bermudensis HTCC2503]|uniref:PtsN, PTS system, nitrogen regulatory IIA component n=1 Tax=Parvularcula bermudensis (strain ATCC BAA-594 / HTCC2503 / KCTC 12087) TaxID=314260 RepID=E0THP4_PARBH|nr:PTS sugar transporter subunit IIA [Parvularcula bermudensis]ADM09340.1 PtsN, PTS system, nitrogen regulatory IIA component [Parvularcula bermudensis HTCC2503]